MATTNAPPAAADASLRFELKSFLVAHLKLKVLDPATITDDAPLAGGDLDLDSIDILELVTGVERKYGLRIEDPDVVRKVFQSVDTLAEYIASSREGE